MSLYLPTPQEFDTWAASYDQDILENEDQFPFLGYQQALDEIVRSSDLKEGDTVLDLGIGTGSLAGRFLSMKCQVYGLDFSTEMLRTTRVKYPQVCLTKADLLGDWQVALQNAFERTRFHAVVSGYTFHHFSLDTKIRLVSELAVRHLLPGGKIVIGDISFQSWEQREAAKIKWDELWEEEDYWITDQTMTACQEAGLLVEYRQISICAGVYAFQPGEGYQADKEL